MIQEGYTSGELHANLYASDKDGPDGVEYRGYWEIKEQL
jgi:hypothetical protein